jgi:hypothetical protein
MQKYSCVKKQSRGKFRINSTKHADFRLQVRITTTLASSRKDQEYGAGGTGVPG